MSGEHLPFVGKFRPSVVRTTAGYAHLTDRHLVEATQRVGGFINEAVNSEWNILQSPPVKRA